MYSVLKIDYTNPNSIEALSDKVRPNIKTESLKRTKVT